MHHFAMKGGVMHAEDVSLETIAAEVGTPTYVYSTATLERHYRLFEAAFAGSRHLIAYSVKANSNLAVIATLARLGAGADIVSEGELRRALAAGVAPANIVFSGVGKSARELAAGLDAGVGLFNVESAPELEALAGLAAARGRAAPIALRVNPDVAAGGHDKISTGKRQDKFGV
ncbi:MAG: diaminopimelate decarboxylase, partial [Caulobacterales bacterium]|nr:diaminopimelate decarboxylase [Caulobacterales bacterium]